MAMFAGGGIYEKLGVRKVINAMGNQTVLGGSTPSKLVKEAMDEAGQSYVEMRELLEKSGQFLADVLGTEAGYITSGCAAAMALSAAACITGNDPDKILKLPDTTGMKNEILIQKKQRYSYDRCYTATGGKLIEVGDENGCSPEQLERAIGPKTAAVAYFIQPDWDSSVVTLEDTLEIAHRRGVPVIADAASQNYPLDYMRNNAQSADLVCFGAKYLGAPHDTGFVVGKKSYVDAVVANGFIGFHTGGRRAIGRPMKVDREGIVGVVAAVDAWFSMNHEDRLLAIENKLVAIQRGLRGARNAQTKIVRNDRYWGASLHVTLDTRALGRTAQQVADQLAEGSPRVMVGVHDESTLNINAHTLNEGEEKTVAEKVKAALSG
jgi:D-glucosaminate-6-phosphate ammonia-lyase